jgi:hypothetical protein
MNIVAPYLKALTAALVAAVAVLVTATDSGDITTHDWLGALLAFLIGLGAVWAVPNKETK